MNDFTLNDGTVYNIILTFNYNKEAYMVYTAKNADLETNNVLASKYIKVNDNYKLLPINTDEEWAMVDKKLAKFYGDIYE
jgi:uncharacterized protein YrzB (UPF0473 family)